MYDDRFDGAVIPAHPLALNADRSVDWTAQRALTRYYRDAGATGIAVGVHTTQFELHDEPGLFRDVLAAGAEEAAGQLLLVAGVAGDVAQAVREAETARELGYQYALVCSPGADAWTDRAMLERATAVGEVLPTIAFYLQDSVGGRYLSPGYWSRLFDLESVAAVKAAPFDRYRTHDVATALIESDRHADIALLTGNDDAIVADLVATYVREVSGQRRELRVVGGLLGQWAVGTRAAVGLVAEVRAAQAAECVPNGLLTTGLDLVEVNAAVFDVAHHFKGCVAGVNEVLAQQGILASSTCLSSTETLSDAQADLIRSARHRFPDLLDEEFVQENRDRWRQ